MKEKAPSCVRQQLGQANLSGSVTDLASQTEVNGILICYKSN